MTSSTARLGTLSRSGSYAEAEKIVLRVHEETANKPGNRATWHRTAVDELVKLYEAWHDAEPAAGHDAKAGEWRDKKKALGDER